MTADTYDGAGFLVSSRRLPERRSESAATFNWSLYDANSEEIARSGLQARWRINADQFGVARNSSDGILLSTHSPMMLFHALNPFPAEDFFIAYGPRRIPVIVQRVIFRSDV
jgi:hypothetical protein